MTHAFLYIAFILPFTAWLGFELKKKYSLKTYWPWIAAAFVDGIIGRQLSHIFGNPLGNFILHASGGVAAALLFVYMFKTLKLHFNWRITLVMLFAFVCMLGVLNELAEYSLEFLGFGPFSFDPHDTWRDLVANTTGAMLAWGTLNLFSKVVSKK